MNLFPGDLVKIRRATALWEAWYEYSPTEPRYPDDKRKVVRMKGSYVNVLSSNYAMVMFISDNGSWWSSTDKIIGIITDSSIGYVWLADIM